MEKRFSRYHVIPWCWNFRRYAPWDFSLSVGLVIAGGVNSYVLKSAEISYNFAASFETLPDLPEPMYYGCVVIVNTTAFAIGGYSGSFSTH